MTEDGESSGYIAPLGGLQEAVWHSFAADAPSQGIRDALAEAISRRKPASGVAIHGLPTREGFVFRWSVGRRRLSAEVALQEWDGGTQLHLTFPGRKAPKDSELRRLSSWLKLVLAGRGWRLKQGR